MSDINPCVKCRQLAINLDEYQLLLEKVRDNRNEFEGSSIDYMQGYRDGQQFQANMIREMLP